MKLWDKEVYKSILKEYKKEDLPVLYNANFGHASPIGIIPLGSNIEVDFTNKKIKLTESPTKSRKWNRTITQLIK